MYNLALRKIITEENELLYKISKPVEKFDDKLSMLIDDMFDTMHKAKGVGLAAPQIGVLRRIVVIEINNIQYELVNPVITEQSGEQIAEEGCLSIPGFYAKTRRPARVKVEAYDRHGDKKTYTGEDLLARAFCHELDHLDGILFKSKLA